ncbi:hypothetical protein, unlikely [Trypanosoma brucei gambiense DAL972]|uniref:Uncharacterized protein n=1 Tax=Trypanosoma brucei gambiense (strain MHOM/CI/86/DAL972) TaxID=679716 RepID=D0A9J9_TRYB9|nr:hypothetical protein, unlikely [Trypanosoma brucei gambiense DAL972]CBH18350.1 hypothetical protein, unlikely [Trypanosoma brucei gambiense DAL972]|eukprot:XP_011780614.1 hypothetical protein, unlikely [Trypanosoma brucei gambiense DAL972]
MKRAALGAYSCSPIPAARSISTSAFGWPVGAALAYALAPLNKSHLASIVVEGRLPGGVQQGTGFAHINQAVNHFENAWIASTPPVFLRNFFHCIPSRPPLTHLFETTWPLPERI